MTLTSSLDSAIDTGGALQSAGLLLFQLDSLIIDPPVIFISLILQLLV
jgi:hypothetical protein